MRRSSFVLDHRAYYPGTPTQMIYHCSDVQPCARLMIAEPRALHLRHNHDPRGLQPHSMSVYPVSCPHHHICDISFELASIPKRGVAYVMTKEPTFKHPWMLHTAHGSGRNLKIALELNAADKARATPT